jgi:hypothetical protein
VEGRRWALPEQRRAGANEAVALERQGRDHCQLGFEFLDPRFDLGDRRCHVTVTVTVPRSRSDVVT